MSHRIVKRRRAEFDLLEHYLFIGQDNLDAADRLIIAAELDMRRLAEHPALGQTFPLKIKRFSALRYWPIKGFPNYLLFYVPVAHGIEIVRILYGTRDLATALRRDD